MGPHIGESFGIDLDAPCPDRRGARVGGFRVTALVSPTRPGGSEGQFFGQVGGALFALWRDETK